MASARCSYSLHQNFNTLKLQGTHHNYLHADTILFSGCMEFRKGYDQLGNKISHLVPSTQGPSHILQLNEWVGEPDYQWPNIRKDSQKILVPNLQPGTPPGSENWAQFEGENWSLFPAGRLFLVFDLWPLSGL